MIFTDFFEQVNYLLKISKVNKGFQWFYKPHPNELKNNENYIYELKKKYPNVIFLGNQFSHNLVLKLDPYLIITNFGTVAHEFAYFKIPVINTGDNPHINYNFSLNPKNKNELKDMIINLNKYFGFIKYTLLVIITFYIIRVITKSLKIKKKFY